MPRRSAPAARAVRCCSLARRRRRSAPTESNMARWSAGHHYRAVASTSASRRRRSRSSPVDILSASRLHGGAITQRVSMRGATLYQCRPTETFRVRHSQKSRLRGRWRVRRLPVHARFNRASRRQQSVGRLGGPRRAPQARQGHGVAALDGVVYAAGGIDAYANVLASVEAINGTSCSRCRACSSRATTLASPHSAAASSPRAAAAGRGPGQRAVERRGLRRPRVAFAPPLPEPRARMAAAATASALSSSAAARHAATRRRTRATARLGAPL